MRELHTIKKDFKSKFKFKHFVVKLFQDKIS